MKSKRYQDHPFYLRWLIWLRWMPFAWVRGIYWYISQFWTDNIDGDEPESLDSCIGISIGVIQATKMHWVYSGEECMAMMKQSSSPR